MKWKEVTPVPSAYGPQHGLTWEVLLALDRLGNALTGGNSQETISERIGRHVEVSEAARAFAHFLDLFDPGHVIDVLHHVPEPEREAMKARFEAWKALARPGFESRLEAP